MLGTPVGISLTGPVRIIGGMAGGRLLSTPKGLTVRPTPDLVRQAVFNSLGPAVEGATVLDLFSGTGALGLEFLSRGAAAVLSVELSSRHARFIRDNVRELGLPADGHELRVQDVFGALRQLARASRRFDFIVADPPFGPKTGAKRSTSASQQLLDLPETRALLAPGGRLVLGHARRDRVGVDSTWVELRVLEHGDSTFRILCVEESQVTTAMATTAIASAGGPGLLPAPGGDAQKIAGEGDEAGKGPGRAQTDGSVAGP